MMVAVVDDDTDLLELIADIFMEKGVSVLTAESGNQLFELLEEQKPDQIILDLNLPDIRGDQIALLLKSNKKTRDIPVLLISSHSDLPEIAQETNVDSYLQKPFDTEQLVKKVLANFEV